MTARQTVVYRRYVHLCSVCSEDAPIELHVGEGGNYRAIFTCRNHDATPKQRAPETERIETLTPARGRRSVTTVYLSGPISLGGSLTGEQINGFVARFTEEAARLRDVGFKVINPCECPTEDSWEAYMRHGLRALADSDLVAVLPRWSESRGSSLEVFLATQLGIPIVQVHELIEPSPRDEGEPAEGEA